MLADYGKHSITLVSQLIGVSWKNWLVDELYVHKEDSIKFGCYILFSHRFFKNVQFSPSFFKYFNLIPNI